jgi:glutathione peroxidase
MPITQKIAYMAFGLSLLLPASALFAASSVYDFTLPSIDGQDAPLSQFKGKVLLLVNVASKCGYTPQYAGLESLYEKYKDQGLVVIGFPANNFGAQEPGTNAEIKTFCSRTYKVSFPMYAKILREGRGQDSSVPLPD